MFVFIFFLSRSGTTCSFVCQKLVDNLLMADFEPIMVKYGQDIGIGVQIPFSPQPIPQARFKVFS